MSTMQVIDRTLFPGSHCMQVKLDTRVSMRETVFCELSSINKAALAKWTDTGLSIPIPPRSAKPVLPQDAMFVFGNGQIRDGIVSAECTIIISRRTDGKIEDGDRIFRLHAKQDLVPLLRIAKLLFLSPVELTRAMMEPVVSSLFEFYKEEAPPMQPILRQRVYSMDNKFIGHICAACGSSKASLRCACLSGIYYCGKGCQQSDWKAHKQLCKESRSSV